MNHSQNAQEELFVLDGDDDDVLYLYAPLRRAVALVNASAVNAVNSFLESGERDLNPAERETIRQLKEQGLLAGPPPEPPVYPADYVFSPYEVTLFPTTRCNLQCIYCYADANSRGKDMDARAAMAAIDLVCENAVLQEREDFMVGFHGGGEPMLRWDFVQRCAEYALDRAAKKGLTVNIHAASNGVISPGKREFIGKHFAGLNISLDGPKEVQDRQRPIAGGGGSFAAVRETIRHFEEIAFPYGIRATATAYSAPLLTEIVHFFKEECPSLDQLHVEPVWYCGRCRTSGEQPPTDRQFIDHFLAAWRVGRDIGLNLFYSGARLDTLTNRFCAAPGDGFSITPDGVVTSCFEVIDPDDPRAKLFHYGHFDPGSGTYRFQEERLQTLRSLSLEHLPFCRDCFCKWHCAGDCLAKSLPAGEPAGHNGSTRCDLNREITFAQIKTSAADVQAQRTAN